MDYKKWKKVLRKNYLQLFFVFVAFLLMTAVSIVSVNKITTKKLLSASEEALYTVEANINTNLREPLATLVGSAFTVQNMIITQNADSKEILHYLEGLSNWFSNKGGQVSIYNGIYGFINGDYLDGIGWVPPEGYTPYERPWYIAAREGGGEAVMTMPYMDANTHTIIISLAQELYDAEGDSIGVVSLDIILTRLAEYVCSLQQSYGGYGILMDSNLNIMAHPEKEFVGKPLRELSGDYNYVADALVDGGLVSGEIIRDTDGRRMIVFFRKIYNDWFVGMLIPSDSYYSEMRQMEAIVITMGTVLMLMLGLILMRLSAAKMRSDEESRHKSSFLARMSHEIRTPMNAILGMVELMLRKELPADAREEAIAIKQAGTNLLSIINDILDFSKIESGRIELISTDYHLASLLNDLINIIQVRIAETPLVFTVDIMGGLPSGLIGDSARLRQILLNLLSNAVKYTRKGKVSLSVKSEMLSDDTVLLIFEIADTGIGIKPEDMDKLYGDFTQLDTHRNTGIEGTGLGLAITRSLCRIMGGSISVFSEYEKGSIFTVTMPQKISDHTMITDLNVGGFKESENFQPSFISPSSWVLIVDDVEVNLKVAEGLLSPYQVRTDRSTNAKDAIERIKENEYDLVFMDHMMPEMDGVEATKIIRGMKSKRLLHMPIIALTANAVSGMREMFLENGFNDYLEKPIYMSKLDKIMDRWIPEEKRIKSDLSEKEASDSESDILNIEGLDTERGLMMIGGSQEQYLEVLELFSKDTAKRMEHLKEIPDQSKLSLFVINVHSLKSALSSIGAMGLSEQAALLERAGMDGTIDEMSKDLDSFRTGLSELCESIERCLHNKYIDGEKNYNT